MQNFVYVFTEKDRDALIARHYNLLKSDETQHIYIFENQKGLCFDLHGVHAVFSDVFTF